MQILTASESSFPESDRVRTIRLSCFICPSFEAGLATVSKRKKEKKNSKFYQEQLKGDMDNFLIWRIFSNLRGCPLSVDLPLYRQKRTISKWRVTTTIRQLLQLPTGGTSVLGSLRAIASLPPPSNFQDAPVFLNHQLPFHENESLQWQIEK